MEEETDVKLNQIIGTLENKSVLKQKVYSNTFEVFTKVKDNSGIKPYLYSDLLV